MFDLTRFSHATCTADAKSQARLRPGVPRRREISDLPSKDVFVVVKIAIDLFLRTRDGGAREPTPSLVSSYLREEVCLSEGTGIVC